MSEQYCKECPKHENTIERIDNQEDRLNNHSERIRCLELNQKAYEISNESMKLAVADLKVEIKELKAENSRQLDGFLTSIRKSMEDTMKTSNTIISQTADIKNKIKLKDRKEIWALVALLGGVFASKVLPQLVAILK